MNDRYTTYLFCFCLGWLLSAANKHAQLQPLTEKPSDKPSAVTPVYESNRPMTDEYCESVKPIVKAVSQWEPLADRPAKLSAPLRSSVTTLTMMGNREVFYFGYTDAELADLHSAKGLDRRQRVIQRWQGEAIIEHARSGVPASVIMAQIILESKNASSALSDTTTHNLFGHKARKGEPSVTMWTKEEVNGKMIRKKAKFRKYKNYWESIRSHGDFLQSQTYATCFECGVDYKCWARRLQVNGYATDSDYARKLISIIEKHRLTVLDEAGGSRKIEITHGFDEHSRPDS